MGGMTLLTNYADPICPAPPPPPQIFSMGLPLLAVRQSGVDLTTRDSCLTILVEVLTNHILAEKTYFTPWIYLTHCSSFFCWLWTYGRWSTLLPYSKNLSMDFRDGSRSPLIFKTKLYVTTVDKFFQPLTFFCNKELA